MVSSEDNGVNEHAAKTIVLNETDVQCPAHTTEAKLMARVDAHVVPFLCIMYLLAFLDRVNIGNANVYGLSKPKDEGGLNLEGHQYNNALVIFFVPYILGEIPSNILLKKFRPSIWLAGNMFMFGVVTICQGVVKSYGGLLTTRFFLGLFETGMFPGAFYLIGMWYRRHEAQKRYSFFFSSTTLAGAFGGLLAAAIGKMAGLRGYSGWRWVFILEGGLTVAFSLVIWRFLPDFPEDSRWLTAEEKAYISARLSLDQGQSSSERPIGVKDVLNVFRDWKIVAGGFMYFGLIVPAYGYAYFAPGIIKGYGYGPIQTQLHSVPPWAAAFGLSLLVAFWSDKLRHRMGFAVFAVCVCIAGFGILIGIHDNKKVEYAGLFLVAMGAYTAMPVIVCWFNMNLGGHHRRSIGSAWQVAFGNIGGIIAVFAFLAKDAPKYTTGYSICLAFTSLSIIACLVYGAGCYFQNKRKDREAAGGNEHGLTVEEKADMGDLSPDYRYML